MVSDRNCTRASVSVLAKSDARCVPRKNERFASNETRCDDDIQIAIASGYGYASDAAARAEHVSRDESKNASFFFSVTSCFAETPNEEATSFGAGTAHRKKKSDPTRTRKETTERSAFPNVEVVSPKHTPTRAMDRLRARTSVARAAAARAPHPVAMTDTRVFDPV